GIHTQQRRPAAPHLAAGRPPRTGGLRLRRLAGGGGAVVVADAAPRPAGPAPLALQVGLGVRRLARAARGPAGARLAGRGGRVPRAERRVASRLGGPRGRRRRRGPGALRPRVGGAARLRRRARREADRRRPDLRRAGLRRPSRAPRDLPRGRPGRRPARRLLRRRPAVGQPDLRLAGSAPPPLPMVDGALPAHLRALRPRADRPLPRVRRVLGGARGRRGRPRRRVAAGAGPRGLRRRRPRARPAPPDRREPRRHHRARRAAAARPRPARHGRAPVRVRPRRSRRAAPAREPHGGLRRLHGHPRLRHAARVVGDARGAAPRGGARRGRARGRRRVEPDRARLGVAGPAGHAPGAGRARARLRGADEHAGDQGHLVEVADGARRADGRPRGAAAGGHGGRRPPYCPAPV
ncbi:MAG: GH77, partial [uncultured Solirubrobacteraceae bacterium]